MRMPTSVLVLLGAAVAVVAVLGICLLLAPHAVARGWERPVEGAVLRPFSVVLDRFPARQRRGVAPPVPPGAREAGRGACVAPPALRGARAQVGPPGLPVPAARGGPPLGAAPPG